MSAKPVQISIDTELLERIDRDPEARAEGRSAFIRSAVELYLTAKERRGVEERLTRAYAGKGDAMLEEIAELLGVPATPPRAGDDVSRGLGQAAGEVILYERPLRLGERTHGLVSGQAAFWRRLTSF